MKNRVKTTDIPLSRRSRFLQVNDVTGEVALVAKMAVREKAGKLGKDMRHLLYSPDVRDDEAIYSFYVGLSDPADIGVFVESGLRYDLIVVQPGTIGDEFMKTSGHEHVGPYPEIYEVLSGTALFLLQKGNGDVIDHFAAVAARAGEKILVPPGYAHATVNIGDEPLVFSDLVMDRCKNHYETVKAKRGLGYYALSGPGGPRFVKNPSYRSLPAVVAPPPSERPELGLLFDVPVYDMVVENPATFAYLSDPEPRMEAIRYLADQIEGKARS